MTPTEKLLELLAGRGEVKKLGKEWVTRCPAHDDHAPSLNVTAGRDGTALVQCRSRGCDIREICRSLGIPVGYLFPDARERALTFEERTVKCYQYKAEDGTVLFETVRLGWPKDFRQRRPAGGGWVWNLAGVRLVPYRLPELVAAGPQQAVFVCEGEKDADAVAALGLVATTNPMGAGKWRAEYRRYFEGRRVVMLPHNDAPGRSHAEAVKVLLNGAVESFVAVELPGLPPGGDVSDWLAAGGTAERLADFAAMADAKRSANDFRFVTHLAQQAGELIDHLYKRVETLSAEFARLEEAAERAAICQERPTNRGGQHTAPQPQE